MKNLTKEQLKNCVWYSGAYRDIKYPLKSGEIGVCCDENKHKLMIVSTCSNCGDFNRISITKRKLKELLKRIS